MKLKNTFIGNLINNKSLINQFIRRDINGRYKGSYLGIIWSFITPLFMLFIYTFVFSVIFQARWGTQGTSKIEFALVLFAGLIIFNIFSDVISRAPSLITGNINYVKKVVFPLEIFPVVILGASLFHASISFVILIIGVIIAFGKVSLTVLFLPIVIIPLCLITLGIAWFISSLGVYIRDVGQIISVIIPALMFLSPIFYPISSIPEQLQVIYYLNPLTYVIEDVRRILIWGEMPHLNWLLLEYIVGIVIAYVGYKWFEKTRKGFADVI